MGIYANNFGNNFEIFLPAELETGPGFDIALKPNSGTVTCNPNSGSATLNPEVGSLSLKRDSGVLSGEGSTSKVII